MLRRLFRIVPEWVKEPIREPKRLIQYFRTYHGKKFWCPVCKKSSRRFGPAGEVPLENCRCMFCGALARHRFVWPFLNKMTNLFDGKPKKVLHVGPELFFIHRFKKRLGRDYITADLLNPLAMVKMDITNIQYPDEHFDVIYCSHVLEHVQDDKMAMRELYRVLKQSGWAIILVPILAKKTFEDPSVVDASERLRLFGQSDHVRRYGLDFIDRLRESGFKVTTKYVSDLFDEKEIVRMGLSDAGEIFYCTKA